MVFFKVSKWKSNTELFCLGNQPLNYTESEKLDTKKKVTNKYLPQISI